jgi:hypothetical protein
MPSSPSRPFDAGGGDLRWNQNEISSFDLLEVASCRRSKRARSDQENGIRRFGQLQPCSWRRSSTSLGFKLRPQLPLHRTGLLNPFPFRGAFGPPAIALDLRLRLERSSAKAAQVTEAFHQAFGRVSLAGRFRGPFTGMLRAKVRANNTIAENALSQYVRPHANRNRTGAEAGTNNHPRASI